MIDWDALKAMYNTGDLDKAKDEFTKAIDKEAKDKLKDWTVELKAVEKEIKEVEKLPDTIDVPNKDKEAQLAVLEQERIMIEQKIEGFS